MVEEKLALAILEEVFGAHPRQLFVVRFGIAKSQLQTDVHHAVLVTGHAVARLVRVLKARPPPLDFRYEHRVRATSPALPQPFRGVELPVTLLAEVQL